MIYAENRGSAIKNRFALTLSLILFLSIIFITPVKANAAMPPILTVVVVNPPDDLSLSIALTQAEQTETKLLERQDIAWEAKFKYFDHHFWSNSELYNNAKLIVASKDYNFEVDLGLENGKMVCRLCTLDLNSQTLSKGFPAWRAPVTIALRVILTLLIEGIVFYLFGYREKRSWIIFLIVNLITQGVLHILLSGSDMAGYAILIFWFAEIVVLIIDDDRLYYPLARTQKMACRNLCLCCQPAKPGFRKCLALLSASLKRIWANRVTRKAVV